jgi:hypothetical protein
MSTSWKEISKIKNELKLTLETQITTSLTILLCRKTFNTIHNEPTQPFFNGDLFQIFVKNIW